MKRRSGDAHCAPTSREPDERARSPVEQPAGTKPTLVPPSSRAPCAARIRLPTSANSSCARSAVRWCRWELAAAQVSRSPRRWRCRCSTPMRARLATARRCACPVRGSTSVHGGCGWRPPIASRPLRHRRAGEGRRRGQRGGFDGRRRHGGNDTADPAPTRMGSTADVGSRHRSRSGSAWASDQELARSRRRRDALTRRQARCRCPASVQSPSPAGKRIAPYPPGRVLPGEFERAVQQVGRFFRASNECVNAVRRRYWASRSSSGIFGTVADAGAGWRSFAVGQRRRTRAGTASLGGDDQRRPAAPGAVGHVGLVGDEWQHTIEDDVAGVGKPRRRCDNGRTGVAGVRIGVARHPRHDVRMRLRPPGDMLQPTVIEHAPGAGRGQRQHAVATTLMGILRRVAMEIPRVIVRAV